MMQITFTAAATRQMRKFAPATRAQVTAKIEAYAATGAGDVKALQGRDGYRLRSGDYRILFDLTPGEMQVFAVGHRRDIYD